MSISFKAMCRRTLLFILGLLLSGCASQIQKTLDRSIMIEERCVAIEQALPLEQQQLKNALVEAIAVRLVGTCVDGSQQCLEPAPGAVPPPTLLVAAQQVQDTLAQLKARQQSGKQRTAVFVGLDSLVNALRETRSNTEETLRSLSIELRQIKDEIRLNSTDTCNQRSDCMLLFAKQIAAHQPALNEHARQLREEAASFLQLAQRAATLANQTAPPEPVQQLSLSARQLEESARQLAIRLDNGGRTLGSLFSHDIEIAATDLMAARLYEKGADRLLAMIDRTLRQLERTIDKIDSQTYGGASLMTGLFSGEMQDRFDLIFTRLAADRYPSKTAKLAFASAACRRLGSDAAAQNGSMFSPFLYAALIRVEVDISPPEKKKTLESVRADWEKNAGQMAAELKDKKEITDFNTEFQKNATKAYEKDATASNPSAPGMLQQVALCAGVAQELALKEGSTSDSWRERVLAACGSAVMDATLAGRAFSNAASQASAQRAIETAPPGGSESTARNALDAADARAWRDAMEAVLAASVLKKPGPFEGLCKQITSQINASRCMDGPAGNITLDFDASFAKGQPRDKVLELQLVQLADILNRNRLNVQLVIDAYASLQLPSCPASTSAAKQAACAGQKNQDLANSRADWAFAVLKQRMGIRFASANEKHGNVHPLSYDTPFDRRIRVTILPAPSP